MKQKERYATIRNVINNDLTSYIYFIDKSCPLTYGLRIFHKAINNLIT